MPTFSNPVAATTLHLGPGHLLAQYRLVSRIGQGGMGTVYRAQHVHLKNEVALKLLPFDGGRDPERVARFFREMQAIGRVVHPNVVRALDAGHSDGAHYLVMELVDGADLSKILRQRGRLAYADAAEILRQAALGLAAIDQQRLIHRDLKPSNLLLTREGIVKIADLGLARLSDEQSLEEVTHSGTVLGTADYMSPEQCEHSHDVDIRADLYSLGCTLFKMLTGHAPFEQASYATLTQKMIAHLTVDPPDIVELAPDIPAEMARLIGALLEKNPAQRWSSPAALAEALTTLAQGNQLASWCPEIGRPASDSLGEAVVGTASMPSPTRVNTGLPRKPSFRLAWIATSLLILIGVCVVGVVTISGGWSTTPSSDDNEKPDIAAFSEVPETDAEQSPSATLTEPIVLDANRDLDTLPLGQWHKLLEAKPIQLVWPEGADFTGMNYDAKARTLFVHGQKTALIQLGQTRSQDYQLQMQLHQAPWTGGAGLFWDYRQWTDDKGRRVYAVQVLRIVDERDIATPELGFAIRRSEIQTSYNAEGKEFRNFNEHAWAPLEFLAGEQNLRITIREGRLDEVVLSGTKLPRLTERHVTLKAPSPDVPRPFGAFCAVSSTTFRDPEILLNAHSRLPE